MSSMGNSSPSLSPSEVRYVALSPRDERGLVKKKTTIKRSGANRRKGKTDWKRVRALTDADIVAAVRNDPDAELLTKHFWKEATLKLPEKKVAISLRLDKDVLDFFKSEGDKYQTRMNAILRTYMQHRKQA